MQQLYIFNVFLCVFLGGCESPMTKCNKNTSPHTPKCCKASKGDALNFLSYVVPLKGKQTSVRQYLKMWFPSSNESGDCKESRAVVQSARLWVVSANTGTALLDMPLIHFCFRFDRWGRGVPRVTAIRARTHSAHQRGVRHQTSDWDRWSDIRLGLLVRCQTGSAG